MSDFKLDPKKYEGHTEGPLGILRPSSPYEPYGIGAVDKNGEAGIMAEVYHEPDANLFADAPDILAHCVNLEEQLSEYKMTLGGRLKEEFKLVASLEAEKAELIETLNDANDTLKALLEMASNEIWDAIGGQACGAVSAQVDANEKALKKAKGGE